MYKKSAFTFIEVIIAIAVFAIGVLAVLRLITQNLVMLDITQSRMTATFLAKEGIELVYNMRDSNIEKGLPWGCVLKTGFVPDGFGNFDSEDICMRDFSSGVNKLLQISFDPDLYTYTLPVTAQTGFATLWTENRLYYMTGNVGGHQIFWYSSRPISGVDPTFFSRYIVFSSVREGSKILPRDSILKIESHVLYNKGTKTGEVVLESFIGNY